jgi:hypothetical protein
MGNLIMLNSILIISTRDTNMTAQEASKKTKAAAKRIKKQQEQQAIIDANERERERIEAEKALEQDVEYRLKEILKQIENAVEAGRNEYRFTIDNHQDLIYKLEKKIQALGYKTIVTRDWYPADPPCGVEGYDGYDSGFTNHLNISW